MFGIKSRLLVDFPCPCTTISNANWKKSILERRVVAKISDPNSRQATLLAKRKQRVKLQDFVKNCGASYSISDFLNNPMGIESMINRKALQRFQELGPNTYRCTLQNIQLLEFKVAPVIDLSITPSNKDCVVELLSCKFEGSQEVEQQNEHFTASMRNRITWNEDCVEPFLDVDVQLRVQLEIYTMPFLLLPTSTIEAPGTVIMQALVDRLVPLLLQQLLQDYNKWVQAQSRNTRQIP